MEALEFIYLASYERSAREFMSVLGELDVEERLRRRPTEGVPIPGSGGVRKLRVAVGARGRRGGARVLYYYHEARPRVYLLLVYAKNAHDAPGIADLAALRRVIARIEEEP